jgi:ribosome recycling factor
MDESRVKASMQEAVERIRSEVSSIRTGRAVPALVENIMVSVYGGAQKMKIMELASVTAPDTQTLVISPWDKSIIGEMKAGIMAANVGFNPSIDSEILRISIPPLTTEDRERYVKILNQKIEEGRVKIRQIRGDQMHDLKKSFEEKEISEDERDAMEKKLQALTDEFIGKIEVVKEAKEKELLGMN